MNHSHLGHPFLVRAMLVAVLAICLDHASASAQRLLKLPNVEDTAYDRLIRLPAPGARCMALSETRRLLAVGHHARFASGRVSLFRLDADGKPTGEPLALDLPRPEALAKTPTTILALAFHPIKPLLYVWQDIDLPKAPDNQPGRVTPAQEAGLASFDHLAIFKIDTDRPELVVSLCRGELFGHNKPMGGLAVDVESAKLYIPNLRGHPKNDTVIAGSYEIDGEGLPIVGKEPGEKGVSAIRAALQAGKPVLPQRMATYGNDAAPDLHSGTGIGFTPIGKDVVLYGGFHDVAMVTWTPENRDVRLDTFLPRTDGYRHHHVLVHPTLSVAYSVNLRSGRIFRVEHVGGHITMAPQLAELQQANFISNPIFMKATNTIAIGGPERIYFLEIDAAGRLLPKRRQTSIGKQEIEALAYWEKLDRLYVGMEKAK